MRPHSPSVLIVRLDAIGDAVTLVPLIAALRSESRRIGAVLSQENAGVFSRSALDRRHVTGPNIRALASEIEARRYDVALIPTEKPLGYRIAKLGRVPERIGFENGWGKPLKTLWVRRMCTRTVFRAAGLDPRAPHECEVVFSLASALLPGVEPSRDAGVLRPFVLDTIPEADARVAFQVTGKWLRLGAHFEDLVQSAKDVAAVAPVRCIAAQYEAAFGARFQEASGLHVDFFESIGPWKEALAAARAVVAPDSGAVHIAGMVGTPVVAAFAWADFGLQTSRWSPWAAPNALIRLEPGWPALIGDSLAELLNDNPKTVYRG